MARKSKELPKEEVEKMFYKMCAVIAKTDKIEDAAKLLRDLLSSTEAEMIAKRIKIAEMLLSEIPYKEISEKLKVSYGTIFKVQEWLKISGEGYRQAIKKTKGESLKKTRANYDYDPENWNSLKRRYPMYYWPEILLENIIATSNKKQQEKIKRVLNQLGKIKKKDNLFKKIEKIMKRRSRMGSQQSK